MSDKIGQKTAGLGRAGELTEAQAEAAQLLAEDELTDEQIARRLKIARSTLSAWKRLPAVEDRIESIILDFQRTLLRHGIARLDQRLARLDRDWRKLQRVVEDRAKEAAATERANAALIEKSKKLGADDEQCRRVYRDLELVGAGMKTGHVVRIETPTELGTRVEFRLDGSVLAEMRAMEMQAAKETGQWVERQDVTSGGRALGGRPDLSRLTDEELDQLDLLLQKSAIGE